MKVIPLNSKHSWDSKHPDSFPPTKTEKKKCQDKRPQSALGNSSTFREIVKDQLNKHCLFLQTDSEVQQKKHSSENNGESNPI